MPKRPRRQLRISLAAKCQLLFGVAVVLIISAALFVPWQRMEQLTQQLNQQAASALADHVLAEHMNAERAYGDMPLLVITRGKPDEDGPDSRALEDDRKKENAALASLSRSAHCSSAATATSR